MTNETASHIRLQIFTLNAKRELTIINHMIPTGIHLVCISFDPPYLIPPTPHPGFKPAFFTSLTFTLKLPHVALISTPPRCVCLPMWLMDGILGVMGERPSSVLTCRHPCTLPPPHMLLSLIQWHVLQTMWKMREGRGTWAGGRACSGFKVREQLAWEPWNCLPPPSMQHASWVAQQHHKEMESEM